MKLIRKLVRLCLVVAIGIFLAITFSWALNSAYAQEVQGFNRFCVAEPLAVSVARERAEKGLDASIKLFEQYTTAMICFTAPMYVRVVKQVILLPTKDGQGIAVYEVTFRYFNSVDFSWVERTLFAISRPRGEMM